MFYVRLYQIEKKRIGESPSSQCKYLKSELENLKKYFLNNSFYDNYRTGRTELDEQYFVRRNYDILADTRFGLLDRYSAKRLLAMISATLESCRVVKEESLSSNPKRVSARIS